MKASTTVKIASPGKRSDPPRVEIAGPIGDHRSPLRLRRLRAEPEKREAREQEKRRCEVEHREHEQRPGDVRKHIANESAPRRAPEQACGLHVLRFADRENEPAHDSRVGRPRDDDDRQSRIPEPRAEHGGNDHRENDRRKREEEVGRTHERAVGKPTEVAGDAADNRTDEGGEDHRDTRNRQRSTGAVENAAQHVAPEFVGAEQVMIGRSLQGREYLVERIRGRDEGSEDRDHDPRKSDHKHPRQAMGISAPRRARGDVAPRGTRCAPSLI